MSWISEIFKLKSMPEKIVLRDERNKTDSRYLSATLSPSGDLVIEGQDIGDEVRKFFDSSEYEWAWTIRVTSIPTLKAALGNPSNLMNCLKKNFSDENAAKIGSFLKEHGIEYEAWSRVGD